MKISFAVNNLRSLVNVEPVELRPLTLLVGANNSGKSTFLRTFALLKQSHEENITEPILWNDNYVDFGDFTTAVRNGDRNNEISFSVKLSEFELCRTSTRNQTDIIGSIIFPLVEKFNIYVKYNIDTKNEVTYLKSVEMHVEEISLNVLFEFEMNSESIGIFINERSVKLKSLEKYKLTNSSVFNLFKNIVREKFNESGFSSDYKSNVFDFFIFEMYKIVAKDGKSSNSKNSDCNIYEFITYFYNISYVLMNKFPLDSVELNNILSEYNISNDNLHFNSLLEKNCRDNLNKICEISALNITFQLLGDIENELRNFFLSSSTLGSLRSYYTRSFSLKGLDVSKITVDGRNLSMFLLSLKENGKLTEFSNWTKEIMGFEFDVEKGVGDMSIFVIEGDSRINLIDSGFGLSNVLPVLAQIWLNTVGVNGNDKSNRLLPNQLNSYPICIEEPEIHLHQRLQARLADAFTNALEMRNKESPQPLFIVETHSEVFINRLGALIEEGKIKHEDVQVILFNKKTDELNSTEVTTSTFNEEGALIDWPYGFMYY